MLHSIRLAFCGLLVAGMTGLPSAAHGQLRAFGRAFTANLPGRLIVTGNSVMTCDRGLESAATCNAVEQGEPGGVATLDNDGAATAFIDLDGAGGDLDGNGSDDTFNSSAATLAFAGTVEWAGLYWWGTVKATEATRKESTSENKGAT